MDEIVTTLVNTVLGGLALFGFSQVLVFIWTKLRRYENRDVIKTYNSVIPHIMRGVYGYFLINSSLVKSMVEYANKNDWESVKFYLKDLILDIYASFIERYEDRDDLEAVRIFKSLELKKWIDKEEYKTSKPRTHNFIMKHEDPILRELKEIKRGISYFERRDRSNDMGNMMKGSVTVSGNDEEE